jgi:putative spermidine/putrescine transport system permease protein
MKRIGDRIAAAIFIASLVFTIVFLVVPLVVALVLSFDAREFIGPFPPTALSLHWYRALLDNSTYWDGLKTSLQIGLCATAVSVVAGGMAALALDRYPIPWRGSIETALLSPKFVPTVVIGFSILGLTSLIGIRDGWWRLFFGHVIITLPFTVRATLAGLVGVRRSLVEAAMSLGATEPRAILDVVVPLARTGIVSGALFAFVLSFDEVAVSIFLSDPFTTTLPVALVAEMRANLNLTIAAVSTLFVVLTVVLIVVLDRLVGLDRVIGYGIYRT